MQIVDNRVKEVQVTDRDVLQVGDVLLGGVSGGYYLVVSGKKLLRLDTLKVQEIDKDMFSYSNYRHTGVKFSDITITFKGAK